MIAASIGKYRLLEQIGVGRDGTVYRAQESDPSGLHREVALKVLPPLPSQDGKARQRFLEEAGVLFELSGKSNIVNVYDAGISDDGRPWISMELLPSNLEEQVTPGPADPPLIARMLTQLLQGLTAIHARKILHNDLKPSNILTDAFGNCRIGDFGLASRRNEDRTMGLCTVRFAAPEVVEFERSRIGPHSDLYSLGHLIYMRALGRDLYREQFSEVLGFGDESAAQSNTRWQAWHCSAGVQAQPLDQLVAGFPPGLAGVIARLMAKPIEERYATADEALADLGQVDEQGQPMGALIGGTGGVGGRGRTAVRDKTFTQVARERPWLVGALGVMLLALGGVLAWPMLKPPRPVIVLENQGRFEATAALVPIRGRVSDLPQGATLRVDVAGGGGATLTPAEDGSFDAAVRVESAGQTLAHVLVVHDNLTLDRKPLTFVRHPPQRVEVLIRTAPAVEGAVVQITLADGRAIREATDPQGHCLVTLPYGKFGLEVAKEDYTPFVHAAVDTGLEPRRAPVVAELSLAVGVVPLVVEPAGAELRFLRDGQDVSPQVLASDPGGQALLVKLPIGQYGYSVRHEGYDEVAARYTVLGGENKPLRVALRQTAAPAAVVEPVKLSPLEADHAYLGSLEGPELLAYLRAHVGLECLRLEKPDPALRRVRLWGVVLNADELTELDRRLSPLGGRIERGEVRVDADRVAQLLQEDLRQRGLTSAKVRGHPRPHGGSAFLRVTFDRTPGYTTEQVRNLCLRYVFRDDQITLVAY